MIDKTDIFSIALFFAALLHAIVILGVSFEMPDIASQKNNDNNLEIVLVNSSNNIRDDEAEAISEQDNLGGGSDALEAETPLPFDVVNPMPIESVQLNATRQQKTSALTQELLTASSSNIALANPVPQEAAKEVREARKGPDIVTTKSARQLERERLIAKIAKSRVDYQKRPRKEFLSPTTKSSGAASYLSKWIKKVNKVGNANMPARIKDEAIVGVVIVSLEIAENGTLVKIILDPPSPHRILNDYTKRLLREASPFDPFPDEEYFNKINVLVISRSFEFDAQQGFSNNAVQ